MKMSLFVNVLLLLWMRGYAESETITEPSFHVIPLGHNSLLIKWKLPPNKVKGFTHYVFAVTKMSGGVTEINRVSAINGHISSYILALKTNTRYKINVEISGTYFEEPFKTVLEARTNKVEDKLPFKPDFDYQISAEKYSYPELKITWLPCGKGEDCGTDIAGAYFYVKYKEMGFDEIIIVEEFVNDYVYINDCHPGNTYKFIVVSVYGNYETESDPKDITFPKGPSNFETMEALTGGDVTIPCKLSSPTREDIAWNWTSSFLNPSKVKLHENGDLFIRDLEVFDGGKYSCYLQNSSPPSIIVTFLHIKAKTQITNNEEFGNAVVKTGEDFQMNCRFWHDRSLSSQVTWIKNGRQNAIDSNTRIVGQKDDTIVILKTKKENSGNYSCVVNTSLDSVNATFTLNVI